MQINRITMGRMVVWFRISVALMVIVLSSPVMAARWDYTGVARVVAFGDVHGACDALQEMLLEVGLINADGDWSGGNTHLVSVGDLIDRGAGSRCVLDLLMHLERQAKRAHGRVHVVLGNHEVMVLTGDRRYVTEAQYLAFGDSLEAATAEFVRAFSPAGRYGRWLLKKPVLLRVNDTVFMHGGISPFLKNSAGPDVNLRVERELEVFLRTVADIERIGTFAPEADAEARSAAVKARLAAEDVPDGERALLEYFMKLEGALIFHPQSPFWYRGTARNNTALEEQVVDLGLIALGAKRVVVGHTPTSDRRIHSRFGGKVLLIDTGMLAEVYSGRASALEITQDGVRVYYTDEDRWTVPEEDALEEDVQEESNQSMPPAGSD